LLNYFFICYYCFFFRYVTNWKIIQAYYKVYGKAKLQSGSLIDRDLLKQTKADEYKHFSEKLKTEIEKLRNSYKENKDDSNIQDFLKKHPEKSRSLLNLLNQNITITRTFLGGILSVLTVIFHLRGTPINELNNYRKLLLIVILTIMFFIVYAIEIRLL